MPPPIAAMPMLDLFLPIADPDVEKLHEATALYTRDPIVGQLLDLAGWPMNGGRLLDPGAGDGQFTVQAVLRLVDPAIAGAGAVAVDDAAGLASLIEAWEIHPVAVVEARERVVRVLVRAGWTRDAAEDAARRVVIEADFLAPGPRARRYDLCIGNPPYAAFAKLPERLKALYRDTVPEHARADLMLAFLDRCADVLVDGGVLSFVTADRWLFNDTAADLRAVLGRRFGLAECYRLDASSAFYRPKIRRAGSPPRVHPVAVLLTQVSAATRALTREPIYPGTTGGELTVPDDMVPLGEVVDVRLAPWLGTHGVFTLDRADAAHLPPDVLVPCMDTHDVVGDVMQPPTRVAIRTRRGERPCEAVCAHLAATVDRLPARARQVKEFWLPAEGWGPLPYPHEAVLIPRIAKRVRAIRLPAGVLPINHNLTVVSKPAFGLSIDELIAALDAPETQQWIEAYAPRLDNGYFDLRTNFLRRIPVRLPAPAARLAGRLAA